MNMRQLAIPDMVSAGNRIELQAKYAQKTSETMATCNLNHAKVTITPDLPKMGPLGVWVQMMTLTIEGDYDDPVYKKFYDTNYARLQKMPQATSGCYVATAVYGSYDCPQVWTLRRFRDYTLAETWYGRAFIHTYYAISPTLVKWFGHTAWFRKMWKSKLDRMVARLNASGVADTPYEDRHW